MRQWIPLLAVPVLVLGLVGTLTSAGHDAKSLPGPSPAGVSRAATPRALGSPVATPLTAADVAATVTALQASVAAQRVDLAVLTIRVEAQETTVATLLEALPEQTALDGFQQNQIDDLAARMAAVEAIVAGAPIASPMASPLASTTTSPTPACGT
ncbi:MAG: hypothetical protein ACJ789_19795 [Thermomicrobiales bacterium]